MPLDPAAKRFLDRLAALNPPSALTRTVAQRREALESLLRFMAPAPAAAQIEECHFAGPAGPVPLRIYTPPARASAAPLPGLVYFHGGGLVAGTLDTHDGIARALAAASGCRLLSVSYRLAPESPFPAAIADAYAAVCAVAERAEEFGIDPERLAVGGDSAGATLAAVVCQMAAQQQKPRVALQFLLCPIMDFAAQTPSRRTLGAGYFLDEATLRHDLEHYLAAGGEAGDPRVSPARAGELRELPTTCIHTAEFDPLCDEGREYAERLEHAGVRTVYRCHPGMIHLFYGMGAVIPYAATAYSMIGADIRALLI
jgi:acetyl esterase